MSWRNSAWSWLELDKGSGCLSSRRHAFPGSPWIIAQRGEPNQAHVQGVARCHHPALLHAGPKL